MRRFNSPRVALLLVSILLLGGGSLMAQSRNMPEFVASVASQLRTLNETMSEMHELLERQVETQALDLLLKRAQLASAEVARLDRTVRRLLERRTRLEAERASLEARIEGTEALQRSRRDEGPSDVELDNRLRNLRSSVESNEEQLRALEAEIVEMASQLDRKRVDLQSWEELLDRRLSGV